MGERDDEFLDCCERETPQGEVPALLERRDADEGGGVPANQGMGAVCDDAFPDDCSYEVVESTCDSMVESVEIEPDGDGDSPAEEAGDPSGVTLGQEAASAEFVEAIEPVEEQAAPKPVDDDAPVEEQTAATESSLPNRFGEFLAEGVESVRALSAAHKAHAGARDELEALDRAIAEREAELAHRRDIEGRFEEIVAEESRNLTVANDDASRAQTAAEQLRAAVATMKDGLDAMKDEDAANERRLKAAREAAEAKEASSRESASRLQRRVDDAKRNLERVKQERDEGMAAARAAIDAAQEHLSVLRAEYAEIRRNPSANSAGYTVRSAELEREISDAMEALRNAQATLPAVERETEQAIELATRMVAEAERPIAAAKDAFDGVVAAADRARDAHDEARKDAEARQKELRRSISEREKDVREQEREHDAALQRAHAAQEALDEARDIHANPAATEALVAAIEADRARRGELSGEVERLAAEESAVRDSTRTTRTRFLAAIASVVVFLLLMLAWTFVAQ